MLRLRCGLSSQLPEPSQGVISTMTADPNDATSHFDLGKALADQERFDDAITQYRKADELWQKAGSQDRKRALCCWADALREQEHYDEASDTCQEAIRVDPEYADAYLQLGRVRADQELFG
jgi:tetratricopeptide (TPR) repeat protein